MRWPQRPSCPAGPAQHPPAAQALVRPPCPQQQPPSCRRRHQVTLRLLLSSCQVPHKACSHLSSCHAAAATIPGGFISPRGSGSGNAELAKGPGRSDLLLPDGDDLLGMTAHTPGTDGLNVSGCLLFRFPCMQCRCDGQIVAADPLTNACAHRLRGWRGRSSPMGWTLRPWTAWLPLRRARSMLATQPHHPGSSLYPASLQ
jgi:hypothetical protein